MSQKAVVNIKQKTKPTLPKKLLDYKLKINIKKNLLTKKYCLL